MKFAENLLKQLNRLLNIILLLLLLLSLSFAFYALWDNHRVYDSAREVQERLRQWKPEVSETGETADSTNNLAALRALNPDVWAWLEMENTGIDYPIVQGETNLSYISLNVYREYELAGSIFLDSRNTPEPMDAYLLVYGHDVEEHRMFGDLRLYRKAQFFTENRDGILILNNEIRKLRTLACFQAPEGEKRIFDPEFVNSNLNAMLEYVRQHAEQIDEVLFQYAVKAKNPHFLALTTCTDDYKTDSRTIVLAVME